MEHYRLRLCALPLMFLGLLTSLKSQEAIQTSGGNASGNGGSVSYSVGQVVYTSNKGVTGSVAQGVQQPYEISVVINIKQTTEEKFDVFLYPNPTTEYLVFEIENFKKENLTLQLFNIDGKLLKSNEISKYKTIIKTDDLVPSTYFLRLIKENKVISEFKIIKK